MKKDDVADSVARALAEGPFSQKRLASELGLSYDAIYSWAHGLRHPRRKHLEDLVAWLDEHGDRLKSCAEEIRDAMDGRPA